MRLVLEHLDGLGPFVARELPDGTEVVVQTDSETVVSADGFGQVLGLRTVVAAYESVVFDVARPRTLLSPEHVARITEHVKALPGKFASFRLSAAGADSPELMRLRAAIAEATGLADDPDDGELLLRLRKADGGGWELLLRLTPRPLSARAWRTERYEGGLNATIAAAIVQATDPQPTDRFLDMMCGSGTLLIERLAYPVARIVGYDISPDAIAITNTHLRNAAIRGARVELVSADVRSATGDFDTIVANLPWGTSVGSHDENPALYREVLATAAALGPRLFVLTHEIKVFEATLADQSAWSLVDQHRFFQKGHWPRLYVLHREGSGDRG